MAKNRGIPLYYQLATILTRKIMSGEYTGGVPLPSENALAEEYQVSRITVRQALASLESDGIIVRKRGKGTFVTEASLSVEPAKLTGSMQDLFSMGIKTSTEVLQFGLAEAAKGIAGELGLPEGTQVVRIERLRLAKGNPFSYILNFLPPAIGGKIQPDDLLAKPLLRIVEDNLGINLASATQRIEADVADSYVAPLLKVRVGDPLLKIARTVFDSHHKAVMHTSVLYRGDRYYYTVTLEREKSINTFRWRHV